MSLLKTGSHCLDLVNQVSECYKSNPKAAQKHLEVIKQYTPAFLEELKTREKEHEKKRDHLQSDEASLERQINSKEAEKNGLRNRIGEIEARRARNEAQLEDRRKELRAAEEQKRRAEKEKDKAITGTVAGGVGAVVLGIFFPPSLAVTVPAVAATGTVSIIDANKAVDTCRGRIRDVERDIEKDKREIESANDSISYIERDISSLQSRLQNLYSERGQLRKTILFLQQAVTYFGQLQVTVKGGQQRTDLLQRLVDMAARAKMKQRYKILNKSGVTVVANSFAEAWARVEDSLMSGNEAGFLNIEFVEIPQIE